jgi:hypothetical protein
MRALRNVGFLFAVMLLASWPAAAQYGFGGGAMTPPEFRGVLNPVVGSGAVYQVTNASGGAATNSEVEIIIVGKDSVAGKDAYWVEIGMKNANMGQIYVKVLDSIDDKKIMTSRMIMQMPGQPPMEMPSQMVNMQQQRAPATTDVRDSTVLVGTESVTTPAGTFSCQHYKTKDGKGDFWLSSQVTPWGLVKTSGDAQMELVRVITGATDHITGTPVPFSPAAFGALAGGRGGR